MTEQKTYTAGQKVGAGKYVCIDCGKELTLDKSEQGLRKCPACACEEYQCFPMGIKATIRSIFSIISEKS